MATYNGVVRSLAYASGDRSANRASIVRSIAYGAGSASLLSRNSIIRVIARSDGTFESRSITGVNSSASFVVMVGASLPTRPSQTGFIRTPPVRYCLNRGKNTGGGAPIVYWLSPNYPDPTGLYYPYGGTIPWSQITNVIWAGTTHPSYPQ